MSGWTYDEAGVRIEAGEALRNRYRAYTEEAIAGDPTWERSLTDAELSKTVEEDAQREFQERAALLADPESLPRALAKAHKAALRGPISEPEPEELPF